MILSSFINILYLVFGLALMTRKPYRNLYFVQAYAIGNSILTFLYLIFFHNWYFYLALSIASPGLLLLAYWDVARRDGGKVNNWVWPTLTMVILTPFLSIGFIVKIYLASIIAYIFISFNLLQSYVRKNPILLTWSIYSTYMLLMKFFEVFLSESVLIMVMRSFTMWMQLLLVVTLLLIVLRDPISSFLRNVLGDSYQLVKVSTGDHSSSNQIAQEADEKLDDRFWNAASLTLHKASILMRDLNKKEYLTAEELCFYLGIDSQEIESFLRKYNIKKIFMPGYSGSWMVRRRDVIDIE